MVHDLSHGLFRETDEDSENSQWLDMTNIHLDARDVPWVQVPRKYKILKFILGSLKL